MKPDRHTLPAEKALAVLLADPTLHFAVGGHTHQRMVRSFARPEGPSLVFIDPGTLHRDYDSGFALVDLERNVVDYHDMVEESDDIFTLCPAESLPIEPQRSATGPTGILTSSP